MTEKSSNYSVIGLIEATQSHVRRFLNQRIDYLSGLTDTFFIKLSPEQKIILLRDIRAQLGDCSRCKLSEGRMNIVFGEGDPAAELMFVGEGPGAVEDKTGRPFVGRAGELLDKIITAMKLKRKDVYIANIVKCRPPENRDPEPDEIETCKPFLERQISIINPRVIITLGAPASHSLLDVTTPISRLRGRFSNYKGIPVMPTYHPSYLLRNPSEKKGTWLDVQKVMKYLHTEILENAR